MQRPPKFQKNPLLFQFVQPRKVITPDCFTASLQQIITSQTQIKSTRDSANKHQTLTQVDNIEQADFNKNSQSMKLNDHKISTGFAGNQCRSFKIRNFGLNRIKVKENTIPISIVLKNGSIGDKSNLKIQSAKCIQTGHGEVINLKCYNHNVKYEQIGTKIAFYKLNNDWKTVEMYDEWCFVLSESLFYGSILEQTNLMKLKNLLQNLHKYNEGIKIMLKLNNEKEIKSIITQCSERKLKINYLIWSKNKYVESVNVFDITEVIKDIKINRYICFEDSFEISHSLFFHLRQPSESTRYQATQDLNNEFEGQERSQNKVDFRSKYVYLRVNGIPDLMKFSLKFRIARDDDQLIINGLDLNDETDDIMSMVEIEQKIKVSETRRLIKKYREPSRKPSSSKQMRVSNELTQSKSSVPDKNLEFKRKMLQYVKILEQDNKTAKHAKQNMPSEFCKQINQKMLYHSFEPLGSKSHHQIISQLLKNNNLVAKQILKFQDKTSGLMFLNN